MRNRLRNIVGYIKKGRWRWYTIAGCFALAVTIFTSYALIRPAITIEQKSTDDEAAMLTKTSFTDPDLPEVTVSGMLPKGGGVSVSEVKGEELTELETKLRDKIRSEQPGILFVADSAYDIEINKTDGTDALKGAQFELYRTDATSVPAADHTRVPVRVLSDEELAAANITKEADTVYYEVEKDGTNYTIDMTNASSAVVYSLDKDSTYYLRETKAPDGYNLLENEIEVHLNETNSINVVNNSGSILSSTGGIGTTIFYIVGGALVLGAVVVIIARRRVRTNKK